MGAGVCMGVEMSRNCRWESMQESKVSKVGVGVHMRVKGSLEWGENPRRVNPTTLAKNFYCNWEFVLCLQECKQEFTHETCVCVGIPFHVRGKSQRSQKWGDIRS